MKNKVIIIMSWLLVLVTALIIFGFSWQKAPSSSQASEDVVVKVLEEVMPKEEITKPTVKATQMPIRKGAHFLVYMLLGFTLISAIEKTFKLKLWLMIVISESFCILYAILDEVNQIFREGRTPYYVDVLVDSGGACVGVFSYLLIMLIFKRTLKYIEKKREKQA